MAGENGNGNGNSVFGNVPWQVKALGAIGFPAVMAIWLLWLVTGSVAEVKTQHEQIKTLMVEHADQSAARTTLMIGLLERICRRLGKNDYEREACR